MTTPEITPQMAEVVARAILETPLPDEFLIVAGAVARISINNGKSDRDIAEAVWKTIVRLLVAPV